MNILNVSSGIAGYASEVANASRLALARTSTASKSACTGDMTPCARELLQAGLQMEGALRVKLARSQGDLRQCSGDLSRCTRLLADAARPVAVQVRDDSMGVVWVAAILGGIVGVASGIGIGYGLGKLNL